MNSVVIGISGFMTAFIGSFVGMVFSILMKEQGKRLKGSFLGLLGGFTLGIVCFDLLPEAFEASSLFIAIVGLGIGLILAVILDGRLEYENKSGTNAFFKAAIFMAIGIGIHNFPSGVALGSLFTISISKGIRLVIALILHGIPEGLTLGIFFREGHASRYKLLFIAFLTSLPMGVGAFLGGFLNSPWATSFSLSFAGALILYITLRETLPAASDTWKGRTTTIGNVLGLIAGMLLVSLFH